MKCMKQLYILMLVVFFVYGMCGKLYAQNYFSWKSNTGNNATVAVLLDSDILIDGEPIQPDDEIGVFTPDGLCVGGIVWCGEKNRAITVWGSNTLPDTIVGIDDGEKMHFRIWQRETNTEYENVDVSFSEGDGIYKTNGTYVIGSLIVRGNSPIPLQPKNNELDVSINTSMVWRGVNDALSYSVQIARDYEFSSIVTEVNDVQDTTLIIENLEYSQEYFWRVRSELPDGDGEWSAIMKFTTQSELSPHAPGLIAPADNATGVILSPEFVWEPVAQDVTYRLQISLNEIFTDVKISVQDIADTTYVPDKLDYGTDYYWRVRAYSDDQGGGDWSSIRKFTTTNEIEMHILYLDPGWNMISSHIIPVNNDMAVILEDIYDNLVVIKNGKGEVYWPDAGIYDLDSWDITEGYQIYMDDYDILVMNGTYIDATNISLELKQGWNTISYLLNEPLSVTEALSSIAGSVELVKAICGSLYWPEEEWNIIEKLLPGHGYYIYVNEASTLDYPSINMEKGSGVAAKEIGSRSGSMHMQLQQPRIYNSHVTNTGSNATILVKADGIRDDSEIGVWNQQNRLVGSGVVRNGRALITVWGNNQVTETVVDGALEGEQLSLTLWSSWDTREHPLTIRKLSDFLKKQSIDEELLYQTNNVNIAVVDNPITDIPANYNLYQNFPNPFNPSTSIRYTLPKREKVTLEVYNMLGQRIEVLVNEEQSAGYHQVEFQRNDLASGVYIYRLTAGYYVETKRMILMR